MVLTVTSPIQQAFTKLNNWREGAHFCRMDLHTHSPASECSSYKLPSAISALLPEKGLKTALNALVKEPWTSDFHAHQFLRIHAPFFLSPTYDPATVQEIATVWCAAIDQALEHEKNKLLPRAWFDLERYLLSLYFPEDFVLRCYIEELELVALTDHNHAGYLIPRLAKLGTWYELLTAVNASFRNDITETGGALVRQCIIMRLEKAREYMKNRAIDLKPDDQDHQDDADDPLATQEKRLKHIDDRLRYWQESKTPLRPLVLLPGTEITVSNIHVLAIFPPDYSTPWRIAQVLNDLGIPEAQWGRGFEAAATASVQDTLERVAQAGGVAIPAHANSSFKGLLPLFRKGLALNKVLAHPALLALEITDNSVMPTDARNKTLSAWESLKKLDQAQDASIRGKTLCFTKGSDAHECRIEQNGTGRDMGTRYTNIKIDLREDESPQAIFNALRLALLHGPSRIIEYPTEDGYNYVTRMQVPASDRQSMLETPTEYLLGVQVDGGYADGLCLRFNPWLNCLIGNGGTTTVLRMVLWGLELAPFMDNSAQDWLPTVVRVFWKTGSQMFCVERTKTTKKTYALDSTSGPLTISEITTSVPAPTLAFWPSKDVLIRKASLSRFQPEVIGMLADELRNPDTTPLLILQPHDLFASANLFTQVLARPMLKMRQIIWSTGSATVPTALDADKIIVTQEIDHGTKMEVVCAGDLHEEDIRNLFIDQLEGGRLGFNRRKAMYML